MTADNLYTMAFSHLSEADRAAMEAYQARAVEVQARGTDDSTVSIETILKQVPGARRALKHYDAEVGKLMRQQHSAS